MGDSNFDFVPGLRVGKRGYFITKYDEVSSPIKQLAFIVSFVLGLRNEKGVQLVNIVTFDPNGQMVYKQVPVDNTRITLNSFSEFNSIDLRVE